LKNLVHEQEHKHTHNEEKDEDDVPELVNQNFEEVSKKVD
jgi:hypothetical protein